jgi:hypothetical protein
MADENRFIELKLFENRHWIKTFTVWKGCIKWTFGVLMWFLTVYFLLKDLFKMK